MPVVLNIAVGSFAVLLKSVLPPQTAKSKTAKCILLRSVLPPKMAKSKTAKSVLLKSIVPLINCQE